MPANQIAEVSRRLNALDEGVANGWDHSDMDTTYPHVAGGRTSHKARLSILFVRRKR